jgi:hypothetical protein
LKVFLGEVSRPVGMGGKRTCLSLNCILQLFNPARGIVKCLSGIWDLFSLVLNVKELLVQVASAVSNLNIIATIMIIRVVR